MTARKAMGLDESLGALIGEVHRQWRARLNERLRPLGLSQSRWLTLRVLSRGGTSLQQNALAARLGVEPSTLVGILDGLARDGFIERKSSARDRRIKTVHLTDKARGKIRRIDAIASELRREIMQDLDERALGAAVSALDTIRNRLAGAG
jgi:MarR family transcriptional regulator for hemolysin